MARVDEINYLRVQVEYYKTELDKVQTRHDELQRILLRESGVLRDEAEGNFKPIPSVRKTRREIINELIWKDREQFAEMQRKASELEAEVGLGDNNASNIS